MENEHIVLINFDDINSGVYFMTTINTPFSFIVDNITYDYLGNVIQTPNDFDMYNLNEICLVIYDIPSPGVLYVNNGFLKYYKEV
jgi:hypothetical protein